MPRLTTLIQILRSVLLRREISLENRAAQLSWGLENLIAKDFEVCNSSTSRSHDPFTNRETIRHHPTPVVYELRDVTFNPSVGTLGHRGHRIRDSVPVDLQRANSWDSSRLPGAPMVSGNASTALRLSTNYYHFIAEDLPRIALLKQHSSIKTVYTQAESFPNFVRDALDILKVHPVGLRHPVRFEKLCYAGPMDGSFWPSPTSLEITRDALIQPEFSKSDTPMRQIYLSRRKSTRSLNDEEKIENFLLGRGFEVIFAEELSLNEQLRAFAKCRTLIGPHGAGLTNSIFMPAGGQVLEIMSRGWAIPVFERIAGYRLNYSRILIDEQTRADQIIAAISEFFAPS